MANGLYIFYNKTIKIKLGLSKTRTIYIWIHEHLHFIFHCLFRNWAFPHYFLEVSDKLTYKRFRKYGFIKIIKGEFRRNKQLQRALNREIKTR